MMSLAQWMLFYAMLLNYCYCGAIWGISFEFRFWKFTCIKIWYNFLCKKLARFLYWFIVCVSQPNSRKLGRLNKNRVCMCLYECVQYWLCSALSSAVVGKCTVSSAVVNECTVSRAVVSECTVSSAVIGKCTVSSAGCRWMLYRVKTYLTYSVVIQSRHPSRSRCLRAVCPSRVTSLTFSATSIFRQRLRTLICLVGFVWNYVPCLVHWSQTWSPCLYIFRWSANT